MPAAAGASARAARGCELQCVSRHWLQFALGRGVSRDDACSAAAAHAAFAAADYDIRELLVAITASDAFRSRKGD